MPEVSAARNDHRRPGLAHRVDDLGVALGAVALWGARVRLKWLLLGTAALSMLPSELIEHRYAIPAFALFILLREPEESWLEGASLTLMTAIALILVHGISAQWFKL